MQYSLKKQSWMEFINESMPNNIKNEAIDRNMNEIQSTQMNNINYPIANSHINLSRITNSDLHHPSVRIPSFETSNDANNKQQEQQDKLTDRK
jgi:hypothetical protein